MTGNWYDGLVDIKIENGDALEAGDVVVVYGRYAGAGYVLLDNTKLYQGDTLGVDNIATAGQLIIKVKDNENKVIATAEATVAAKSE